MQGHQILNLLFLPICLKKTILIKLVTQSQFVNSYFLYYNHFYVRIVCLFTLVANVSAMKRWLVLRLRQAYALSAIVGNWFYSFRVTISLFLISTIEIWLSLLSS